MAVIKSGILSSIRGSVGRVTGRIVNGRNILSQRPGYRKQTNDPATLKRRDRFRLAVKFASAINKLEGVKPIWKTITPKDQNFFSFLVQSNYNQITDGALTGTNIITPFSGFPVSLASSEITSASVSADINTLAGIYNFDLTDEVNVKLCMVIYLTDPANSLFEKYTFIPLEFEAQALQLDNPLTFTQGLMKADQSLFESYNAHKTYLALVTLDSDNNPVSFSQTICLE